MLNLRNNIFFSKKANVLLKGTCLSSFLQACGTALALFSPVLRRSSPEGFLPVSDSLCLADRMVHASNPLCVQFRVLLTPLT